MRRNGQISSLKKPIRRDIDLDGRKIPCVSIGWGDIATAYYSTGVPNIDVLFQSTRQLEQAVSLNSFLRFLLSTGLGQTMLKRQADKQPEGPNPTERAQGATAILAEVAGANGETARAILRTPEAYSITADSALTIATRVAAGDHKPGFQTPSLAFGADFVLDLDGVTREDVD